MQHEVHTGQYVLIARPPAAQADYHTLGRSLRYVLKREGLLLEV